MQPDQQPERTGELVFYVDECLKCSHVLTALRAALEPGETMTVAPKGVQDEDWLPIVGQVRWVCLSKDRKMLTRPNELQAILRFKVAMIQLSRRTDANMRDCSSLRCRSFARRPGPWRGRSWRVWSRTRASGSSTRAERG